MPLDTGALTLWTTVQSELGDEITSASQTNVERYINAVSASIASVAGRQLHRQANITELVRGYGDWRLCTTVTPIVSVSAVVVMNIDGTVSYTYATTSYAIEDAEVGWIRIGNPWPYTAQRAGNVAGDLIAGTEQKKIRVTYTAGWITPWQADAGYPGGSLGTRNLPADLEEACIISVVSLFKGKGTDRLISTVTQGQATFSFKSSGWGILTRESYDIARAHWRPDHG